MSDVPSLSAGRLPSVGVTSSVDAGLLTSLGDEGHCHQVILVLKEAAFCWFAAVEESGEEKLRYFGDYFKRVDYVKDSVSQNPSVLPK